MKIVLEKLPPIIILNKDIDYCDGCDFWSFKLIDGIIYCCLFKQQLDRVNPALGELPHPIRCEECRNYTTKYLEDDEEYVQEKIEKQKIVEVKNDFKLEI